jgi:hypothetical protein
VKGRLEEQRRQQYVEDQLLGERKRRWNSEEGEDQSRRNQPDTVRQTNAFTQHRHNRGNQKQQNAGLYMKLHDDPLFVKNME